MRPNMLKAKHVKLCWDYYSFVLFSPCPNSSWTDCCPIITPKASQPARLCLNLLVLFNLSLHCYQMLVILWYQSQWIQLHGTGTNICCDQYNIFPDSSTIALCRLPLSNGVNLYIVGGHTTFSNRREWYCGTEAKRILFTCHEFMQI